VEVRYRKSILSYPLQLTRLLHKEIRKLINKKPEEPMNKGYNKLSRQKITKSRRPPQVKPSKAQIYTKYHRIPEIRFEDQ
jgi:hypothetical protein